MFADGVTMAGCGGGAMLLMIMLASIGRSNQHERQHEHRLTWLKGNPW